MAIADVLTLEGKCDRLKELVVDFVTRGDKPTPANRTREAMLADKAERAKNDEEAVRLALDIAKQLVLDFHRIARSTS